MSVQHIPFARSFRALIDLLYRGRVKRNDWMSEKEPDCRKLYI